MGCMPCLVTPHAKLLKEIGPRAEDTESLLPALPVPETDLPSSQILDPNWELSSSDEGSFFSDEDIGLISRVWGPLDFVCIRGEASRVHVCTELNDYEMFFL